VKRRLRAPVLFLSLLAAAGGGFAQRRAARQPPEPPPADDLQETIEWLGRRLKQYGSMKTASPSEPGVQRRWDFDGMRSDGCAITYRVKTGAVYPPTDDLTKGAAGWTSYTEYGVDLRALDPSLVKAEKPKGWSGGRITFSAGRGGVAVTTRVKGGETRSFDGSFFYVSDAAAVDVMAEALRRAIVMCKE
jgi:hypothetical protein